MFGRIAHRYDLLNRVLSVGQDVAWRRKVARRLGVDRAGVVLDVCTGTGDLALEMRRSVCSTLGTDFCLPMLARARRKARRRGAHLPLFAADALRLPLTDCSVDAVVVGFGVRNFENLDRGLDELIRVLRPGGRLLILEFSRPRGVLAPFLGWWARTVPPRVGRWVSGDDRAYAYLPASVDAFPDAADMCRRLRDHGLAAVTATGLTTGVASLYEGTRPGEKKAVGATSVSAR